MPGVPPASDIDRKFLRRAIALAGEAKSSGNPPFGSLLVDSGGNVLVELTNTTASDNDLSAHPELKAAVWAARNLTPEQALTTTLYTSSENCAMCSGAFVLAGLGKLVFSVSGEQLREIRGTAYSRPTTAASSRSIFEQANYPITVIGPEISDEGRVVHLG
jgi:tRNA(Arg) A34 adenosine deaminase TadA